MATILIKTPSQNVDKWLTCTVVDFNCSRIHNQGRLKVKGVSEHPQVTTNIDIHDLNGLIEGKVVGSLHGYFKLRLDENDDSLKHILSNL